MEENNRKGPGIFYAVVGVATLVVAIIGATFAYFTATTNVTGDTIEGNTATASNASVTVTKVNPTTGTKMVPLLDGTSAAASNEDRRATALSNNCIDKNGYIACQVYKVTVKNEGASGSDDLNITTNLKITPDEGLTNMRWQKIESATTLGDGQIVTNVTAETPIKSTEVLAAQGTAEYYVMIWLSDTGVDQPLETGKHFSGAVTANIVNADGQKIGSLTASFGE